MFKSQTRKTLEQFNVIDNSGYSGKTLRDLSWLPQKVSFLEADAVRIKKDNNDLRELITKLANKLGYCLEVTPPQNTKTNWEKCKKNAIRK